MQNCLIFSFTESSDLHWLAIHTYVSRESVFHFLHLNASTNKICVNQNNDKFVCFNDSIFIFIWFYLIYVGFISWFSLWWFKCLKTPYFFTFSMQNSVKIDIENEMIETANNMESKWIHPFRIELIMKGKTIFFFSTITFIWMKIPVSKIETGTCLMIVRIFMKFKRFLSTDDNRLIWEIFWHDLVIV